LQEIVDRKFRKEEKAIKDRGSDGEGRRWQGGRERGDEKHTCRRRR
jgi:hypothetical protein